MKHAVGQLEGIDATAVAYVGMSMGTRYGLPLAAELTATPGGPLSPRGASSSGADWDTHSEHADARHPPFPSPITASPNPAALVSLIAGSRAPLCAELCRLGEGEHCWGWPPSPRRWRASRFWGCAVWRGRRGFSGPSGDHDYAGRCERDHDDFGPGAGISDGAITSWTVRARRGVLNNSL